MCGELRPSPMVPVDPARPRPQVDVARENNSGVTAAALARQYGNTEVADAIAPR